MRTSAGRRDIDRVIEAFFAACDAAGCTERRAAIRSSSGFDPSVRFIGSHISVLLPFMIERQIPAGGIAMWQDCIRMRSLGHMIETGRLAARWGSYFVVVGAVLPDSHDEQAAFILRNCLEDGLRIPPDRIEVSYLATDERLAGIARRQLGGWQQRSETNPRPFRHKVGVASVRGRNLNIAIRPADGDFEPIANIIIYEDDGVPCGIELALGTSTVVKVERGLDHVVEAYPFPELGDASAIDLEVVRCWKDATATSLQLLREGLTSRGQNARNRLLRRYLSVFRGSPVTAVLGPAVTRRVLEEYLTSYYASEFVLEPASDASPSALIERLVG